MHVKAKGPSPTEAKPDEERLNELKGARELTDLSTAARI
jgi:hypothetical protein